MDLCKAVEGPHGDRTEIGHRAVSTAVHRNRTVPVGFRTEAVPR